MSRLLFMLILALMSGCTRCAPAPAPTPVLTGTVVKVVDADTVDVQLASDPKPLRVRLHAIDAPEKSQAFGKEATQFLSTLLLHKSVQVEPISQDRYDRLVGIIYLGDVNVNSDLVRAGYAWAYRQYMKKSDAKLCALEAQARISKLGLWQTPTDELEAPWEFRNKKLEYVTDYSEETVRQCVDAIGQNQ